jgi:2,4'-dihydroxyacetophenone dioxygenase
LHQSGRIMVYTIKGRWKHREDDWIAGPGSVVLEPAASDHTVAVVASDGPVVALLVVVGDVLFMGPRGEVLAIENWKSAQERYLAYCARSAILPRDLTRTMQDGASS